MHSFELLCNCNYNVYKKILLCFFFNNLDGSNTESDYDGDLTSCRQSVVSNTLPPHIDIECIAWKTVTKTGGRLTIPDSGISLVC